MTDEDVLQAEISRRTAAGWLVVSRGPNEAQMRKPKSFSLLWAFFWFLFLVFGLLIYVFYYMAKKDELVYIRVQDGQLSVTSS